jgi:putative membrane protein
MGLGPPTPQEGTPLKLLIQLVVLLVAAEHLWFLVLEMFLFTKPLGLKTFHVTAEHAKQTAPLMANQGLYNGFLAAGLLWSLLPPSPSATSSSSSSSGACWWPASSAH